jgi:hypothetical protein
MPVKRSPPGKNMAQGQGKIRVPKEVAKLDQNRWRVERLLKISWRRVHKH